MPRKKPNSKTTTKTTKTTKAAIAKREGPPRNAKLGRWDANYLTTNPKSVLVESDLIGLLANPEIWAQMTKEELKHIDTLFPDHTPRDKNGSISLEWLRYDNDWRHGVRQWQADLGAGHLEPTWQREAELAMAERANGKFDKFKEEEFEEFWGQKHKTKFMRAGQSAVLRLPELITANLFREGDFWVYSRLFVREKVKTEVVKDCKIVQIGENSLTFTIPPGTLRYGRKVCVDLSNEEDGHVEDETTKIPASGESDSKGILVAETVNGELVSNGDGISESIGEEENDDKEAVEAVDQNEIFADQNTREGTAEENKGRISPRATEDVRLTVFHLQLLEDKILELDGRIKNPPQRSAWKSFRCQRNNQDMGSLYEIREQYYVWNNPG